MRFTGVIIVILNFLGVENRMLPMSYEVEPPLIESISPPDLTINDNSGESALAMDAFSSKENEEYDIEKEGKITQEKPIKPCSIVVLSNIQNPSVQSLLRKYRYDANGNLIPNSVQYFMKLPQGIRSSPVLVPVNDKAFSPLGGFVSISSSMILYFSLVRINPFPALGHPQLPDLDALAADTCVYWRKLKA